jgi:hypothetical protein
MTGTKLKELLEAYRVAARRDAAPQRAAAAADRVTAATQRVRQKA